ncbi:MAG: glycine zipper 2TM domain-containing protein [Steroidobacteraceae bacterium]
MSKSFLIGSIIGGVILTSGGAYAGYRAVAAARGAEVVSVTATTRAVKSPWQDCHDEQVTRTKPSRDTHQLVGTGVGAALGGLVGSQFGGGNGKILTTVAGVAAGGYAGHQVEKKMQQGNIYTVTERRCATVYDRSEVPDGFDVVYVLKGVQRHVHMDHDPGARIPVKDGRIVVDERDPRTAPGPKDG